MQSLLQQKNDNDFFVVLKSVFFESFCFTKYALPIIPDPLFNVPITGGCNQKYSQQVNKPGGSASLMN